jgi:hypothetical protein
VPIGYQETFEAHLARIDQLLALVPAAGKGLLLNDLQGGPSSCGCGNVQCRWAIDYHVSSTATKLKEVDVPSRFLSEVRKRAGSRSVIPVWTTECVEEDMPSEKNRGKPSTGLCGGVGCATGACPDEFVAQWTSLTAGHQGPIGLLALHTAFQRTQPGFGGGPAWVSSAVSYLRKTVPEMNNNVPLSNRLWVVIEGSDAKGEAIAREAAAQAGVGAVIVARAN